MPKRKSDADIFEGTPKKARNAIDLAEADGVETPSKQRTIADTPSKQRSILKNTHANIINGDGTPKSLRKVLFSTPAKGREPDEDTAVQDSPLTAARNADRSARRKSTRNLFSTGEAEKDDGGDDLDADITQDILFAEDDAEEEEEEEVADEGVGDSIAVVDVPDTPSKQGKLRGRPRGKRRARSPTPPDDLPPHELYFFQNRPGGVKTSTNTLASNALLNHDDYFAQINAYKDPHEDDMAILTNMHKGSFEQWTLELEESFNICLYGYGSKRPLLLDYADYLYTESEDSKKPPTIVIVNGYNPSLTPRDILMTLANQIMPLAQVQKLPLQQNAFVDALLSSLTELPPKAPLYLLIHSIDGPALRKHQVPLSRIAAHPQVRLIASADTLTFPLLWDISLRTAFRFLFHDTTTFTPYTAELDPVEEVNTLLGRSGRRVGGKDGVAYVLRSLPENARNLYRILVAEQLALADSEGDLGMAESRHNDDDDLLGVDNDRFEMDLDIDMDIDPEPATPSKRVRRGRPAKRPTVKAPPQQKIHLQMQGVEYRTLYHKAVEEFVCSSEMSFRTLLKEFHDHDMLDSRKDAQGVERLSAPFGRDELEDILGELV